MVHSASRAAIAEMRERLNEVLEPLGATLTDED